MADNHSILVGTLGMFILDSFEYTRDYSSTRIPALVPGEWYIGGGGTYATIGARMWLPPERIAMVIHPGHDFPRKITEQLEGYSRTLFTFLSDPTHPETTRALNTYTNERREFKYLTAKRQVHLEELYSAKSVAPRYVHVICSPMRLLKIMQEREARFPGWEVQWIWEPVPESCTPSNLSNVQECVSKSMAVFSPNDLEASELLGRPSAPSSAEDIEAIADHFHRMGFPAVVIRSGKRGAFVIRAPHGSQPLQRFWVPPLVQDQSLVVDQTGAGNAFLGGMMAGLARGESLVDAACCGSVSSGLTITQLGLPRLSSPCPQQPASEIWNHDCSPQQLLLQIRNNVAFLTPSV